MSRTDDSPGEPAARLWARYLGAALIAGSVALVPWVFAGERATQFLFVPPVGVAVAALIAGIGPGLFSIAAWGLVVLFLYYHPFEQGWSAVRPDLVRILGTLGVSVLLAWACGSLRAALHKARNERLAALATARSLEAQRQETVRALTLWEETLAIVSHDLRAPLSTIVCVAEILEKESNRTSALEPHALDRYARMLAGASGTIERLIRDLVDFRRLESGELTVVRAEADPADLAVRAVEGVRETARKSGLALELELPERLPAVECDGQRVLQVLSNLLGNAMKATQASGRIRLAVSPQKAAVRFSVEDNGCGIDAEDLPHIFERFRRGRRANYQGTGLGLAIAKGLVEAQGGEIGVSSTPGEGTTIWFSLPVKTPPSPDPPGVPMWLS